MKNRPNARTWFVLGLTALLAGGCQSGSRSPDANFAQIRQNVSTEADVVALLGEPDHRLPGLWIYQKPEEHLYWKIEFDDQGRVARKERIDGLSHTWEDTGDGPDRR